MYLYHVGTTLLKWLKSSNYDFVLTMKWVQHDDLIQKKIQDLEVKSIFKYAEGLSVGFYLLSGFLTGSGLILKNKNPGFKTHLALRTCANAFWNCGCHFVTHKPGHGHVKVHYG